MAKTTEAALKRQIAKLQRQLAIETAKERKRVIAGLAAKMREFGISPEDLAGPLGKKRAAGKSAAKSARKTTGTVKMKYRDPVSGAGWSGRGRPPRWVLDHEVRGGTREELLIVKSTPDTPASNAAKPTSTEPAGTEPTPENPGA